MFPHFLPLCLDFAHSRRSQFYVWLLSPVHPLRPEPAPSLSVKVQKKHTHTPPFPHTTTTTSRFHSRVAFQRCGRKPSPQPPEGGGQHVRWPTGREVCQSSWCLKGSRGAVVLLGAASVSFVGCLAVGGAPGQEIKTFQFLLPQSLASDA